MPTTNKEMGDMLRKRRQELTDGPAYEPPTDVEISVEAEAPEPEGAESESPTSGITVKAPGEPSEGTSFEYEPLTDVPGAWVVYPPGVPCDDTEYRVTMNKPAGAADFAKMEQAIQDAGGATVEPAAEADSAALEGAY